MTSRLRSSPSIPKEKSKATSFDSDTFYYEPEETTGKSYGRARRDNTYRFGDFKRECPESNGRRYGEETEEDPDLLYKRSKDRFGSWEIKDIAGDSPRRLRDGKLLERGITETSKKIPDSREEERNGSRRTTGEVTEKSEKEGILNSSRNGTFFGESLKIRRNGESQRKPSFVSSPVDGITAPSSEDRRIVVGTTIDRARTREEDEDEDDPRRHRHRHRRRHRYLFDGTYGDDHRADDSTREEASSGVDRRKPKSAEKTSRGYELFLANKDSTSFRIEEQRIPRCIVGTVGAASDEANDADREDDRDVDREEEPDIELEDNDRRGARENSLRKSDRYVVETAHKRSISKDGGEGEATRSKDNARRTVRPFGYTSLPTEEFDIRIQKYERALVEPRRDLDLSKKSVSREVDRAPSKRDSSKDRDREVVRRISFRDVDVPRKSSIKDTDPATTTTMTTATTTTTTRRTSFKDQDNGIRARNSFKNDHEGGIKCTIKSRSNDITESNHFEGESTDLGRRSSFKGQRPEIGKISFETREGEVVGKRSSLKDGYGHGHGTDRIFLNDEKIESERRRTYRHESPSSLERIPRDNQKRQVVTGNEKNAKSGESAETTTAGRRVSKERGNVLGRRISFKDRDIDKSERKNSYGVYRDVDKDSNDEGTRRKSGCSFDDRFESFESDRNVLTSRDRVSQASGRNRSKEVVDVSRGETDSRAYPSKEYVRSPEKKSVRHSRALTPPRGGGRSGGGGGGGGVDKDPIRSTESWREDNRLFATRYLRENGRAMDRRGSHEGGYDYDDEGDDGESEPEHEVVRSIAVNVPQDRADNRIDPDTRGRVASTIERNGTTIVRILSGAGGAQSSRGDLERRRRRRGVQQELCLENRRRRFDASRYDSEEEAARGDEVWEELEEDDDLEKEQEEVDEEDYDDDKEYRQDPRRGSRRDNGLIPGIAGPTPSRRLWNYREGGVLITDVEEGQPCLQCGEACPGFSPHIWRKNCTSCKCPREDHDVCHEEWASVRSRLGLKADESSGPLGFSDPRERGLAWAPPGLPPHKVDEYFSMLPEISVPRLGTPGERHRDRQLAFQLPKQDLARAYCRYLDLKHASSADDFMAARNEIALDIGTVQEVVDEGLCCGACQESLKYGSLAVSASKLGLLYHPACFRCTDCKELLVDLAYCVHEDVIFCERHYAEQLKPRCSACDELIFSGEYTKAMNKDWHSGHFCCWQCDESLTGQRYVLRDEHPYCIKCYESIFANGCEECNKIIGIDSKDLSYKDKHWHEACFLCNRCRVSLVDKQFGSKVDKIYCGNCYDAQFASRCDGCGEIFRAGTKKMEYKTRQWHEKCFCCVVCKNPIGTKSFIPREQEIYCASCYEDKFATRCVKCNKIITSGGVTYKNEPWHRDCFTCSHCNNSLAGQRFTSRDDKPYCADCFGELFAKRCTACSKPITGIGGTRFISFEDRHWHNECFICAGCKTSLVGRGFITDGDDIICPECAKAKLM